MKNYIGWVNDHSGSMQGMLAQAAMKDFNTSIETVKNAATREMMDTVVSVVGIGLGDGYQVERQVTVSNPHVLTPKTNWPTPGATPLYDGIGDIINLHLALPDANKDDVSFLIIITTDGAESGSRTDYRHPGILAKLIQKVTDTGRWSFVFRVPKGASLSRITALGIPPENIQEWETTAAGMEQSTKATTQAMNSFFSLRASGVKKTGAFYADASAVNVAALVDISDKISLYVVQPDENGIMIRDKILKHRQKYLKGAAFYQLTKTESKVSHTKLILIRDQATGKFFGGLEARKMIGLPTNQNARLHPGDHKAYDIFIQSESINRKLVAGTGIAYWADKGVDFTPEELEKFEGYMNPKPTPKKAVVQLAQVQPTNKPTPSPLKPTPTKKFFTSRAAAREYVNSLKTRKPIQDNGPFSEAGKRWFV